MGPQMELVQAFGWQGSKSRFNPSVWGCVRTGERRKLW